MGVLDRFEKGIERAVNGAFAKAFRSEVQPVEIASALRRECDDKAAIVGRDRTIVPNEFVVELGPADHDRLGEWQTALSDELSAAVADHASAQRYAFVGPVVVQIAQADDLDTGLFRVRSHTTRPGNHAAPPPGPVGPAYPPQPVGPTAAPAPGGPLLGAPFPVGAPVPAAPVPAAPAPSWGPPPDVTRPAAAPSDPGLLSGPVTLDVDGRLHTVTGPVTVLGRSTDADVVLDDPGVSRRHAEVHVVDGRARIIDLGSTNGTYVDGERVHAGSLVDGSVITVGRSRLVFRAGGGPQPPRGAW